ncbi:unnamed protein product [Adineta steineri]|uniref:Uncharacterized protein n=1 Tax=Adineta steineri TaxID=433720 RepID=A0A814FXA0_9BILA|nr:unnamed protein product [Adineta steineri]CAF1024708.1 unnamed protein product [Adineta steineri]
MSVAFSTDRKDEPIDNATGAPDIAAQQIREHQAATHASSSSQHEVGIGDGKQHLTELPKTSNQQTDNKSGLH